MFHRCKEIKEAKDLFRKLAKFLHPDTGGDNECFILLKECFDIHQAVLEFHEEKPAPKGNPSKYKNTEDDVFSFEEDKLEIFSEISKYSEKHKRFKTDYADSVKEYLEENGFITSAQYNKLVKVYYAFRMDKEEFTKDTK